ncbi:hypothetical protein LTR56_015759 [Elasticomyces elasticus]|nr:hypothetical protein LTR56_015759 [Elasticomyces elasticus]KAK3661970.1 hypothetical protein LTR22_007141 [Elasticomyces elasticus]KAK4933137.1 hypothetical protein LTR49_000621 [Elasticomyces elasticus]KAK5755880.1 hypothetical protein LTS12_013997 [Elasticomyces elasticus]
MATAPRNPFAGILGITSQPAAGPANIVQPANGPAEARTAPIANVNAVPLNPSYLPTLETLAEPDSEGFTKYSFCNIAVMPAYQNFSQEELRLAGYGTSMEEGIYRPSRVVDARFGTSIIHFDVGGQLQAVPERFAVHESVVLHASDFVQLAMNGEWKEVCTRIPSNYHCTTDTITQAKERVIPLPEDQPAIFHAYQAWLYTHSIDTEASLADLVKCYAFAEKLMDVFYKDAVMNRILRYIRTFHGFEPGLVDFVYKNTPEGSPLRRLWCEIFAWCGSVAWVEQFGEGDLVVDLAKLQMRFWNGQRPEVVPFLTDDLCEYHCHDSDICRL